MEVWTTYDEGFIAGLNSDIVPEVILPYEDEDPRYDDWCDGYFAGIGVLWDSIEKGGQ